MPTETHSSGGWSLASSNKYNNFVCLCATPNEHTTVEVVTFWCCYWCGDYFNGLVPGGGSGTTLQKQSKLWPVIFPDFPGDNLLLVAKFDLHVSWLGSGFLVVQNLEWWKLAEKVEKLLILTQSDNYLWKVVLNLKNFLFKLNNLFSAIVKMSASQLETRRIIWD